MIISCYYSAAIEGFFFPVGNKQNAHTVTSLLSFNSEKQSKKWPIWPLSESRVKSGCGTSTWCPEQCQINSSVS